MDIKCEKDLEDYICENQDEFMVFLKKIFNCNELHFLGRQVKIGKENIADLVYFDIDQVDEYFSFKRFYIVELKFRKLQCNDLSQLYRYMNALQYNISNTSDEYLAVDYNQSFVSGALVSFGCDDKAKQFALEDYRTPNNIKFIKFNDTSKFNEEQYCYASHYLDCMKLDERFRFIL